VHFTLTELFIITFSLFFLSYLSLRFRLINMSGALTAFIIGFIVFIFGGWRWFLLLLSFHLSAGIVTKYKYSFKSSLGAAEAKGGARAWKNVLSNGLVASLFALCEGIRGGDIFFAGFLGAISTACSDTFATEIGLLYPGKPRLITNLKVKVEPGVSGGVSPYGEIAVILASLSIGVLAIFLGDVSSYIWWKVLLISLASGFLGSTFDSLMGATVQAQYWCENCKVFCESSKHKCGCEAKLVRGLSIINNHVVNFISTVIGALIGLIIALII